MDLFLTLALPAEEAKMGKDIGVNGKACLSQKRVGPAQPSLPHITFGVGPY